MAGPDGNTSGPSQERNTSREPIHRISARMQLQRINRGRWLWPWAFGKPAHEPKLSQKPAKKFKGGRPVKNAENNRSVHTPEVIVYNNQQLSAKPVSRASKADLLAASEADYAREIEEKGH